MSIALYNCVIIDREDDGLTWWMRSKAASIAVLQFVNYQKHVKYWLNANTHLNAVMKASSYTVSKLS